MAARSSNRILALLLIGVLAVGLVLTLILGGQYVLRERERERAEALGLEDLTQTERPRNSLLHRQWTRDEVGPSGILALGIDRFQRRVGRLPVVLDDLIREPDDLPAGTRWDGPYVTEQILLDHWGKRYRFRAPGLHNPDGYDLWSVGPDRIHGTPDDIGNWGEEMEKDEG